MFTENKKSQCESGGVSFIWGEMGTIAWEAAFQTALSNCSKEVAGEVSVYGTLVKGECMQTSTYFLWVSARLVKVTASQESPWRIFSAFLDARRCKKWAHKIAWKYLTIWRPVRAVSPRAHVYSFLIYTLNSFQGVLKGSSCSSS